MGWLSSEQQRAHVDIVQLLLEYKEHAPRADCRDGVALVAAAEGGHVDVVRLLLEWKEHAPRAVCRDEVALFVAVESGHFSVVQHLLSCKEHVPRAECFDGSALSAAAQNGHVDVVRLLLESAHAPRADCQDGAAAACAAQNGHLDVVRLLLGFSDFRFLQSDAGSMRPHLKNKSAAFWCMLHSMATRMWSASCLACRRGLRLGTAVRLVSFSRKRRNVATSRRFIQPTDG